MSSGGVADLGSVEESLLGVLGEDRDDGVELSGLGDLCCRSVLWVHLAQNDLDVRQTKKKKKLEGTQTKSTSAPASQRISTALALFLRAATWLCGLVES